MRLSVIASLRKAFIVAPHRAGWPFIGGGALLAVVLFIFTGWWGLLPLAFTLFCLFFFRDPPRVTPQKSTLVVAPADGLVSAVTPGLGLPSEISGPADGVFTRVSIFLSVLDVHVNRAPVSGDVVRKVYKPGKFLNADLDKASEDNERCSLLIRTATGPLIGVTQIAGLIARRIVNESVEGHTVVAGGRFGIIRFGSRVDVYLPDGAVPLVAPGQRMVGGETVIAEFGSSEAPRTGQRID